MTTIHCSLYCDLRQRMMATIDRFDRTMTGCDAGRLKVKAVDIRRGCGPVAAHIRLFYDLSIRYTKHTPVTFVNKTNKYVP